MLVEVGVEVLVDVEVEVLGDDEVEALVEVEGLLVLEVLVVVVGQSALSGMSVAMHLPASRRRIRLWSG